MILCAVTVLVLYFHLSFYISRGLDTNRSIVAQVTPLQCPIHLPHDNTYIIHCIVISPTPSRLALSPLSC